MRTNASKAEQCRAYMQSRARMNCSRSFEEAAAAEGGGIVVLSGGGPGAVLSGLKSMSTAMN